MLIDLQIHSTYSDGYLTPTQVAIFLAKRGIKIASLTDHNTVGGQSEFKRVCAKKGIRVITGLELYVKKNHNVFNVLWYNFDHHSPELHKLLRESQMRRRRIMRRVLDRLEEDGFKISYKILDRYNHYVPSNYVAGDLLDNKNNYEKVKKELGLDVVRAGDLIRNYFYRVGSRRLKNSYIGWKKIVELRDKIGGQLVLCHPAKGYMPKELVLKSLVDSGLDGIEKLSPHHSYEAIMRIQRFARKYNLAETGGSDFHLDERGNYPVQRAWDYFRIDSDYLREVDRIIT
ncbi:PHP domain-containing protein [bacterium]|nr:PHP domain-containing protein [bacterium]